MSAKKNRLMFYWNIYTKIVAQDIKSKMSYRADFILSMFGMLFTNAAGAVSFWLIFQNFPAINGWTYSEMIFLYGFCLISATPAQCLFDNNWSLRMNVYSGDFIKYCFRPINVFFYYMSEVFDLKGVWQLLYGIAAVVYAWCKLALPVSFVIVALFVVYSLSASLFVTAILNASAATCFWVPNSYFVLSLSTKLRDFAKYPMSIFSKPFRVVFTFVLPIGFMAYYPCQIFLRPDNIPLIVWFTPLFGVLFFYLSYKFWMKGAENYSGTGN